MFDSLAQALVAAHEMSMSLGELALRKETERGVRTRAEIEAGLHRALNVMREARTRGLRGDVRSVSGLVGGDAHKVANSAQGPLRGTIFADALAGALAVQEVNAAMGVIVAAPTAGAAGVLPGVLLALADRVDASDAALARALAAAGLIGAVIAQRASLSGAEGGCQAETGSAAAMAAAAGVELLGGTVEQADAAVGLALQGTLGLVCDPVGGFVEIPCVFRNATAASIALAGIEMALAGVRIPIPTDEIIDAMAEIGRTMDVRYRETAGGGLAATPTGRRLARGRLGPVRGGA